MSMKMWFDQMDSNCVDELDGRLYYYVFCASELPSCVWCVDLPVSSAAGE